MHLQSTPYRHLILICIFISSACSAASTGRKIGDFIPTTCPVPIAEKSGIEDRIEFGYVAVPEQHGKPDGPVIEIAVARFRSLSDTPRPDPLVMNTGGPGDSNLQAFIPLMAGPMGKALLANRDVVIIELRGLRYSRPSLVCTEVFDAQLKMVGENLTADESDERLLTAMRESHARFVASGVNLSAYNNVETSQDIGLIMTTLGYDRFNLFGASAGTLIAQHVMRDFPDRVRSVVLVAAVPLGSSFFRNMLINGADTLERIFAQCAADEVYHAARPDLESRFLAHIQKLNKTPILISVVNPTTGKETPFVLNGDRLSTWVFASMYFNTHMPQSLEKLMGGDYGELAKSAAIFLPMYKFSYGLSYCVFSAECLDFGPDDIGVEGRYATYVNGVSLFFSPRLLAKASDFWRVKPVSREILKPLESDIPTLILNGELDHVLPPAYIEEMSAKLENDYTYLFPGVAHLPIIEVPSSFAMVLQFLDDPSQPPDAKVLKELNKIRLIGD